MWDGAATLWCKISLSSLTFRTVETDPVYQCEFRESGARATGADHLLGGEMEDMLKDGYRVAWPMVFLLLAVFVGLVTHRVLTVALSQWARERPGLLLKSIVRHGQKAVRVAFAVSGSAGGASRSASSAGVACAD